MADIAKRLQDMLDGPIPMTVERADARDALDEIYRLRGLLDDLIGTVSALHEPEWYEPEGSIAHLRRLRCATCKVDAPCLTLDHVNRIAWSRIQ